MTIDIPTTPADVTAQWVTAVLTSTGTVDADTVIDSVTVTDIGEGTGIFGQIARLDLGYGAGSGPERVVVKLACTEPANLEVAFALGIYRREVAFFEHIGPHSPMRTPVCHFAHMGDDGRFVIVMEDLSSSYDVGDQVVGITPDEADLVVEELAALHATWWMHPDLEAHDWLPVADAPQYLAAVPGIYRAGMPVLEAEWADRLPAEAIEIARRIEPIFEDVLVATAAPPWTFTHGDTRLDNVFFAHDGGRPALIDFQLSLRARGVADIAYMIATSMNTDDARLHWERILRKWHDGLVAHGITDYPWEEALRGYRESALYYLCGAMSLIGSFDTGNERGAAMAEAYTTRCFNHVVDIDAAQVLD
ncbi:MAG: phosphotransferase [Acidimicrobiales bacterium]